MAIHCVFLLDMAEPSAQGLANDHSIDHPAPEPVPASCLGRAGRAGLADQPAAADCSAYLLYILLYMC